MSTARLEHQGGVCDSAVRTARSFVDVLVAVDRQARRECRTIPTSNEETAVHREFWQKLIPSLEHVDNVLAESELVQARADVQAVLNPWLLRSGLWWRSFVKPHGYAGDFRMLEWVYDLETADCSDATQPAVVNLLDGLMRSVHCTRAVWERRAWFAEMISAHLDSGSRNKPLRVLDIACGGSRYLRDVIDRHGTGAVEPTFVDQDPAALSFIRCWLPAAPALNDTTNIICGPVGRLQDLLPTRFRNDQRQFDVVISTGLFDYLNEERARELLAHMAALAQPGGTVAISNFCPDDASRVVKDWVSDWRLIYRTRTELARLFPHGIQPELDQSSEGGLLYARAVVDDATVSRPIATKRGLRRPNAQRV